MLRGRGGCYKHTFYGISSYQARARARARPPARRNAARTFYGISSYQARAHVHA